MNEPTGSPTQAAREVDIDEAEARREAGALWLDVREPEEFARAHVWGAELVPMGEALAVVPRRWPNLDEPINVCCAVGSRSQFVADALARLGYTDVVNVGGGLRAWIAAGHDVVQGEPG